MPLSKVVEEATGSIREGRKPSAQAEWPLPVDPHDRHRRAQRTLRCSRTSPAYDSAVDLRVQMLTSLLEPLIIVVMGAAVAFIAMSIIFPSSR